MQIKKIRLLYFLLLPFYFLLSLTSCSVSKQISKQANTILLNDTAIRTGHIGISIYEPATNKYWYNYNATNYFIPASNTKLFTLYAGMKYLGDSLVGLRYDVMQDSILIIEPAGDPSFLNREFTNQPVLDLIKRFKHVELYYKIQYADPKYGFGWSWDDHLNDFMPLPSQFPMYGNTVSFSIKDDTFNISPPGFKRYFRSYLPKKPSGFEVRRNFMSNDFWGFEGPNKEQKIPFYTLMSTTENLLSDTSKSEVKWHALNFWNYNYKVLHSQPSDSLFKPMMHRSDNFFAEQTLLMASNEHLGYMSDEKIIDTLLKTDLKDVPQKPKWVDGSGLSRYNLFTPQSFVYILNKTKNEFGWDRLKNILPTGGTGTLSAYFKKDSGFIYAKTGTLSNNCALSGFLITQKGKLLIFSILANNYITGATPVRKAVEKFLLEIREKY